VSLALSAISSQVTIYALEVKDDVRSEAKLTPENAVRLVRPTIPGMLAHGAIPKPKKFARAKAAVEESQWAHCKHLSK
jgi:hypothetical protein